MPILKMDDICKYFPGIIANENINFELEKGEIHSILGENGAGKSTLMNILAGFYHPDKGRICIKGGEVKIHSPAEALGLGIGMVHQHFHLSEKHTVYENIILGSKKAGFIPDRKKLFAGINEISKRYGFDLDPDDRVWKLGIAEQQKVEILKIIYHNPSILVFDEPTAVLTSIETEMFFTILKKLRSDGYSIIFISHKLEEVMNISDRITILSRGRFVTTIKTEDTTREDLAERMIGRKIVFTVTKTPAKYGEDILVLKNASVKNNRGLSAVDRLDLSIKKGEIFGIAGVSGNGQIELAEALFGLRRMDHEGYVFNSVKVAHPKPKMMMNLGMKLIPADRKKTGTAPGMSMPDNFVLNRTEEEVFSGGFFLKTGRINSDTKDSVIKYDIKHSGIKNPVRNLSGGNLQKVIVAREVGSMPRFLIAVYPSRGLDIGAIESLHKIMIEEQKKGATILLVSEELDEIFSLADRIGVMFKGKLIKTVENGSVSDNVIALAMGGVI